MGNDKAIEVAAAAPLAASSAFVSADDWQAMREMATSLVKSGFLPKAVNTPEKAIAIILAGRELNLAPMQALRSIHIIEGKPTMGAELMMALVLKQMPKAYLKIIDTTNERCVVRAGRTVDDTKDYEFTIGDAKRAGLMGKNNWRNYPRSMLRSRVVSETIKAVFPDALIGAYTADEIGAENTTDDGALIDTDGTESGLDNPDPYYDRIVGCTSKAELDDLALELKTKNFGRGDRKELGAAWHTRLKDIKSGAIEKQEGVDNHKFGHGPDAKPPVEEDTKKEIPDGDYTEEKHSETAAEFERIKKQKLAELKSDEGGR